MTAKGKSAGRQGGPRRWPDVMIGVLVLALLGGFGTLLAGQRKKVEAAPAPQTPPASTAVIPASPGTVQEEPTPAPAQTATATPAASTQANTTTPATPAATSTDTPASTPPATASTTPAPAATSTAPATPPTAGSSDTTANATEIPPVPAAPPVAPIKPPVVPQTQAQTQSQSPEAQTTPTTPNTQTPAETPAATAPRVTPRSGGAVATSENRTPLRSDYRISLGSFATRKTVDSQTSGVTALGYNVHPIDLGDQYVAQVGPFADEATARQALADIQRAYPGALLYRPRNQTQASSESTASSTNSSTAASSANTTAAPAATTARAPAPSGPTYLQVGAFDRVESAQNLVGTLRDIDFAPTVNNPPDRKTTVLVGPYSGDALLRAEARLDKAGLDHFRVR